jgi:hypothetical protein
MVTAIERQTMKKVYLRLLPFCFILYFHLLSRPREYRVRPTPPTPPGIRVTYPAVRLG